MVQVINSTNVKSARKNHNCSACEWLLYGGSFQDLADNYPLTYAEKRELVKAKQNKYEIQKGEPYLKQFNKNEGQVYYFKSIPAIHQICCKYNLYEY